MAEQFYGYYYLSYFIAFLSQIAILAGIVYLLLNRGTKSARMMLIGGILVFLMSVFTLFSNIFIFRHTEPEYIVKYQGVINIVKETFYLLFAIGLFLFIRDYIKKSNLLNKD